MKIKICSRCKKEKTLDQFNRGNQKDRLRSECKFCQSQDGKIYREMHRKQDAKRGKIYRRMHKEEIKKLIEIWRKIHKKEFKDYQNIYIKTHKKERNQYMRNRRKTDINFKISGYLRNRIYVALKGNPKLSTTMKLVGCSIEKLREHLQNQFTKSMTWQNYGKWHIDHIRPCASFDLQKPSEQRKCFHYTNLQPLWAKENSKKHDKY